MQYIEYPKMLYRGEEQIVVAGADEEESKRSDGWGAPGEVVEVVQSFTEDVPLEPAKRKYQRRPAGIEPQNAVQ